MVSSGGIRVQVFSKLWVEHFTLSPAFNKYSKTIIAATDIAAVRSAIFLPGFSRIYPLTSSGVVN